uniref:YadA C-terminal domain-containing protein n=1 Tax=Dialister invisus TaxID=218538 RepID=UPI002659D2F2
GSTEVITGDQLHTVNQQVTKNTTNITKNTTSITNLQTNVAGKADKNAGNLSAGDVTNWQSKLGITNLQANVAGKADKNAGNLSAGDVTNWQNKLGISALQAGFRVKAGGNQGTVKAGQTLEFVGTNHVETSYNSATRTVTVGLDATAKGKIDNLDNIIAGKASWTIQDAEAVQGKKTINAMTPLTVKGENGVTTKVDAGGLKIGLKPVVTIGSSHPVTIDGNNGTVTGLTNKTWTGSIVSGRAATEDQLAAAMSSIGPVGATVVKGSGNITAVKTVGKNEYTVALKDDIKVKSIDTKTVKVEGKTYINGTGIHANDQKISNVKDGEIKKGGTDAVTGGQLYETNKAVSQIGTAIGKVGNELMRVDRKVNKVGAGAAALAALHPQEYDPEDKWGFAAGFGNYRNAHAVAIGAFYRPNENTLVNIGTTMGDAANMFNAGVSVKLGQGSGLPISRTAMAREINTLHGQVLDIAKERDSLVRDNQEMREELNQQKKEIDELKEIVKRLAAR